MEVFIWKKKELNNLLSYKATKRTFNKEFKGNCDKKIYKNKKIIPIDIGNYLKAKCKEERTNVYYNNVYFQHAKITILKNERRK